MYSPFSVFNIVLLFNFIFFIYCQSIQFAVNFDNPCEDGECVPLRNCSEAITLLLRGEFPSICSLKGPSREPIVCCAFIEKQQELNDSGRALTPFPSISQQKCEEYSKIRVNQAHSIEKSIRAILGEYPHMAAIGYGNENHISWQCAGSLISERFVLTAAHCLYSREFGRPQYVRIGDLNLVDKQDGAQPQNFYVEETIQHPDYRSPLLYHDIALIKLNRDVLFIDIRPACLYTSSKLSEKYPTTTGWGVTTFNETNRHGLAKITLEVLSEYRCNQFYKNIAYNRTLPNGILNEYQICAGDIDSEPNYCQRDSGGPLQIFDETTRRKIYIVGITSIGNSCGIASFPGIYTRISSYVPWIESVVWETSK